MTFYRNNDDRPDWQALDADTGRGFAYVLKWGLAFLAALAVFVIGWLTFVHPILIDKTTDLKRESHQYVETQRAFLTQKHAACLDLETMIHAETDPTIRDAYRAQLAAFIREMKTRAALIDANEVPPAVAKYLETK